MSRAAAAVPPERILEQLLAAMTLEEKIGQLSLYSARRQLGRRSGQSGARPSTRREKRIDDDPCGPRDGHLQRDGEAQVRMLQRVAVEESRLGIPLIFGADVIHGFRTAFPVPLAEAASFEPELARRAAEAAAAEAPPRACTGPSRRAPTSAATRAGAARSRAMARMPLLAAPVRRGAGARLPGRGPRRSAAADGDGQAFRRPMARRRRGSTTTPPRSPRRPSSTTICRPIARRSRPARAR